MTSECVRLMPFKQQTRQFVSLQTKTCLLYLYMYIKINKFEIFVLQKKTYISTITHQKKNKTGIDIWALD